MPSHQLSFSSLKHKYKSVELFILTQAVACLQMPLFVEQNFAKYNNSSLAAGGL